MKRSAFFYIHSVAGLVSGLFVLLMSVSGSLLVFREEIDRAQQPLVGVRQGIPPLGIVQAYTALQQRYPKAQINSLALPDAPGRAFVFSIADSSYRNGESALQVFIHPQTGEWLDSRSPKNSFMNWLGVFHNSLHLKKKGEWLLGAFAVVFMISLLTGCVLYRKHILAVLRFRHRITWHNLHQFIGVYALLFNLMICISGFWMQRYVFRSSFYQTYPPYKNTLKASGSLAFNIDSAIGAVQKSYQDFSAYVLYFARSSKGNTAVYGSRGRNAFIHSRKFADAVFLDSTGGTARTAFVNEIDAGDRYDIINSQVHFGRYGGWPVKLVYGLFGLSSGLLSISGAWLFWKRRRAG